MEHLNTKESQTVSLCDTHIS